MDAERTRANLARLEETTPLLPIAIWAFRGVSGELWCLTCGIKKRGEACEKTCDPCPKAHRVMKGGREEYWREPRHGN